MKRPESIDNPQNESNDCLFLNGYIQTLITFPMGNSALYHAMAYRNMRLFLEASDDANLRSSAKAIALSTVYDLKTICLSGKGFLETTGKL